MDNLTGIQWFPGHMTKALREIEKELALCDLIFYVLDARAPLSSVNPSLNKLVKDKKIVYILNKADLADEAQNKAWCDYFGKVGSKAILTESKKSKSASALNNIAVEACGEKLARYKAKGIKKSLRAMVVGVPNCGKSTLINNLCGKGATITGNKPGVTKGKQWVRISDKLELLDTPGTLWPSFEDKNIANNLAFVGSIKDDVLNLIEVAEDLIKKLISLNKLDFIARFGLNKSDDAHAMLSVVAKKRGFLERGGLVNLEKAAKCFLDEFRAGKLGRVTLDEI